MRAQYRELPVVQPSDVAIVRHVAGQMAAEQRFPPQRQAEIRLMASELAQNHLDHRTVDGRIRVSSLLVQKIPCLTLASLDLGPGFPDVAAFLDREENYHSTTGLGAGLATIRRLADRFALCSGKDLTYGCRGDSVGENGTIVVARCWPECRLPQVLIDTQVDLAGIVCSRSEHMPCGDGLHVTGDERFLRIVLMDSPGIGRGSDLTRAVQERLQEMELIWPPDQLFERLSFALKEGISMEIMRFDRLQLELQCAGVGNVSRWLVIDDTMVPSPGSRPVGVISHVNVQLFRYPVKNTVSCFIHSDGLGRFEQSEMKRLLTGRGTSESSLILQAAFSMGEPIVDDTAGCVWQWGRER